jgi:hypothetical protein
VREREGVRLICIPHFVKARLAFPYCGRIKETELVFCADKEYILIVIQNPNAE